MSESIALNHADGSPVFLDERGAHHPQNGTLLGFWIYLLSDLMIFGSLFATFGVFSKSYAAGPAGGDLFDLTLIAVNTAVLLLSSITYGFAMLAMQRRNARGTIAWLLVTGALGLVFLGIELYEFQHLIHLGAGPQRSAFLSAFFALVGTHGLHVLFGVLWLVVLCMQVGRWGLNRTTTRRIACLSLFWHFLDVVWIGVFTFVYLMGTL
ncbi:cytochrome o ubiquinol oxidase subunit III [Luteimonas marina]|uniref:Cytochrome bo(3) ubiquinol oxidase subunit 3 n=1 Tax=Luteimonas marina TaxID=488485 RepID=A0A5C5U7P1_9GAMM|nr:cytochrome o ubiquinol oxidase subunit III [Luteimonas marina]TWT22441.1 cytochrome o ubiquinol oxidase subunit III [Luteimonas marina]